MSTNPFTLMYGITSKSVISRDAEMHRIIHSFVYEENMYTYLITGIRGSGKTVLLKSIEKQIAMEKGWVVININPQSDITVSLSNRLFDHALLRKELSKWKLEIHVGAITLTRDNGQRIDDPEIIVEDLLGQARKLGLKVLVSIDEVNDTPEFRRFINLFQILINKGLPCYLLMTALKENVSGLINDRAMTFLSRSPRIELGPLDLASIALEYQHALSVDKATAIEMAKLTKGYAFAFQVLGYQWFEGNVKSIDEALIQNYDRYLWNNGYSKFWKDLTHTERAFMIAIASSEHKDKADIIAHLTGSSKIYPIYRERLLEKGLIYMPSYGKLDFVLPRFEEFIFFVKDFE